MRMPFQIFKISFSPSNTTLEPRRRSRTAQIAAPANAVSARRDGRVGDVRRPTRTPRTSLPVRPPRQIGTPVSTRARRAAGIAAPANASTSVVSWVSLNFSSKSGKPRRRLLRTRYATCECCFRRFELYFQQIFAHFYRPPTRRRRRTPAITFPLASPRLVETALSWRPRRTPRPSLPPRPLRPIRTPVSTRARRAVGFAVPADAASVV